MIFDEIKLELSKHIFINGTNGTNESKNLSHGSVTELLSAIGSFSLSTDKVGESGLFGTKNK